MFKLTWSKVSDQTTKSEPNHEPLGNDELDCPERQSDIFVAWLTLSGVVFLYRCAANHIRKSKRPRLMTFVVSQLCEMVLNADGEQAELTAFVRHRKLSFKSEVQCVKTLISRMAYVDKDMTAISPVITGQTRSRAGTRQE